MNRLGLFTGSGVVGAALVPILVLVTAFATGGDIFSSGPLNADQGPAPIGGAWSHADLACKDCHAPFWSATLMGDRCLACHTDVAEELATPNSLHAGIASPQTCRQCHPEHRGDHAALTLYEPNLYPHAEFGFYLIGHLSHADGRPFACDDCHVDTSQAFSQDTCVGCHQDLDATWMASHTLDFGLDCLACHDGIDTYGERFDHQAAAFPLEGLHVDLACSTCHTGANDLDDLRATPTDCVDCHAADDTHQGSLGADCAGCHTPADWGTASLDHNLTDFPLVGGHLDLACETCHVGGQLSGTPTMCVDCHSADDPHAGKFGTDCATCHTAEDWSIIIDESFDHSLTSFSLTGAHARVATCASCHKGGQFTGTPTTCAGCHAPDDAHGGAFGKNCSSCHSTDAWKPANFDHGQTAFRLTGRHASVTCTKCHINGVYAGTPKSCVACHASDDTHNGAFGTDCGSCHKPSSWADSTFDHARSAFPLTGKHTSVTCTKCHVNGVYAGTPKTCVACHASDDAHNGAFGTECGTCHDTNAWGNATVNHNNTAFPLTGRHQGTVCEKCHVNGVYKGTPTACVACHASNDTHNGQFGTNCASCHTTSGWGGATFNHKNTAFPLTGKHTSVTCTKCHVNGVYKGTPTTCVACHASKDAHNGAFGTNCGSCHTTNGWGGATFNHNNTAFPLTGKHTSVTCTKCHINGVYAGTPKSCVACHAPDDAHNGAFGTNCGSCHTTSGWGGATFNHNNTAFPLTGKHMGVTCTKCHINGVYAGTPKTCVACHSAPSSHPGFYGSDCTTCHTTSDWSVKYSGSHTFPMNHKGAGSKCATCHTNSFSDYTCYTCHDQAKMQEKHQGVANLSKCAACHPDGKN